MVMMLMVLTMLMLMRMLPMQSVGVLEVRHLAHALYRPHHLQCCDKIHDHKG
jgi:hypothetical protein